MPNSERLRELAISDAGFVFDPLTGHTYNVNSTALAALRALKEGASPEAVIAHLQESFTTDGEQDVARDVYDLLSRLREHGLVK
ncbi:MAG: HPr-rel-A system PqqD family peptide chaperone [Deltaproteobacteria bacterium]